MKATSESLGDLYLGNESFRTESPELNVTRGKTSVSYVIPFEFLVFVFCIGSIGMVANGAVLWALVSNQRKGNTNTLILNQTVADFYSCTFLIISNALKVAKMYNLFDLTGIWGSIVCSLFLIDVLVWVGLVASITSLVILTLERYFKIVHPVLHRKQFRPWILKAAVVVTWSNGILRNILLGLSTRVSSGRCLDGALLKTLGAKMAYGIFMFVWDFVIPLIVFFYCYGMILIVVRSTRGEVAHTSNAPSNPAARDNAARIQTNVIRTLLLVSATFFFCWTPFQINRLLLYSAKIPFTNAYYILVGVAFLNTAVNPLIYAAKYQPVRKSLLRLIGYRDQGQSVAPMTTVGE